MYESIACEVLKSGSTHLISSCGDRQVISACQIAISNKVYNYSFLKNIIENKMVDEQPTEYEKPLPKHDNVRGNLYYQEQINF